MSEKTTEQSVLEKLASDGWIGGPNWDGYTTSTRTPNDIGKPTGHAPQSTGNPPAAVHPDAHVDASAKLGDGARIAQGATICPGASIGAGAMSDPASTSDPRRRSVQEPSSGGTPA